LLKRSLAVIIIVLMFLSILLLSLPGHKQAGNNGLQAVNGRMELASWDMDRTEVLPLDGEWEFYWNRLLTPADFSVEKPDRPVLTGYMQVPSLWNGKAPGGEKLPVFGCATYRLVLENPPCNGVFGLKKVNARFSSKVFVNGQELLSDGVPAGGAVDYEPGNTPQLGFFSSDRGNIEILVQVANYEYPNSGIPASLELGSDKALLRQHQRNYLYSMAILVILFTTAFLYLNFFVIAQFNGVKQYSMLFFSVFCILFAIANSLADQRPLLLFLPDMSFALAFKLKDFFLAANFIVMLWVFHMSKKGLLPLGLIRIISVACSVYLIGILLLPIYIYIKICLLVMACNTAILLLLLIQSVRLYIRKGEGLLLFIAILAINLYSADAILFSLGFKTSSGFLQVYIMIFAAMMIFLLSGQYFTAIRQQQASLKRTQEAEIAFLRAQINPHFLYNALNSVAALCITAPEKAEDVVVELSQYLRRSFDFKRMDAMSTLARELELLETYLYVEKTRFGDRLKVVYDIDETLNLPIPPLVLQPLVENAVKHGLMDSVAGVTVKVSIQCQGDEAVFTIEDNGIGMEQGRLDCLLEEKTKSGGIGLWNINQRLKMLYGRELSIRSEKGSGTQVTFALPLKKEERRKKYFIGRR